MRKRRWERYRRKENEIGKNEIERKRESAKEKEREKNECKIRKYSHHQEIFKKKKWIEEI